MLKHLYKTSIIALLGVLSFQNSFAQCPTHTAIVSDDTVCSNAGTVAIKISNAIIGAKYVAILGANRIDSIIATTTSALIIMPITKLSIGKNKLAIQAIVIGCPIVSLVDSAMVLVNQPPRTDQRIVSKPYCPGSSEASIIIYGTRPGENYEPNLNGIAIGASVKSVSDSVPLNISVSELLNVPNEIYFFVSVPGCALVQLENKGYIMREPFVDYFYSVVGDTICSSNSFAELLFRNTSPIVDHQIYINQIAVLESFKGESNNFIKKIPASLLTVGANEIKVQALVTTGCATYSINTTASVLVHPSIKFDEPILIGDTVTLPTGFATIMVVNPIPGVFYSAFKGISPIGSPTLSASQNPISIKIPVGTPNGLAVGTHEITVSFTTFGCGEQTIDLKTIVVVKPEVVTSIEEKLRTTNFAVYPNPFSSEITINSKLIGQLKLQITDAVGNIVYQESISDAQDLKLSPDLKSGLYFLQMESEGVRGIVKLIKQ